MAEANRSFPALKWAQALDLDLRKMGLELYDFGTGQTVFPAVDFANQSYKAAIVILVIQKKEGKADRGLCLEIPNGSGEPLPDDVPYLMAKTFPTLSGPMDHNGMKPPRRIERIRAAVNGDMNA